MVYDAIIVGTGSAGGILADRLTDGTGKQVLVLEAGPDFETMYPGTDPAEERSRLRSVRANCTQHSMDTFHWAYTDSSGNQIPYGKNVGGSGSHNGMQSYRATRLQHSLWPPGWHYNDFAPYYDAVGQRMNVHPLPRIAMDPVALAFEESALDLGYPAIEDFNDTPGNNVTRGVGPNPYNARGLVDPTSGNGLIDKYGGRQGPLEVYIRPAHARSNFTLIPDALVDRVLYEPRRGGWHAQAVRYTDRSGATHTAEGKLILVCASAFGSPTLLMRSGIGAGLQVNLPQVGRNYVNQAVGFMSIEYDQPLHGQFGYPIGTVVQVDYHRPGRSYLIATISQGQLGLMLGTQWGQRFKDNIRNWRNWGGAFVFPVFTTAVGRVTLDPTKPNGAGIEYAVTPEDQALIQTGYDEAARIFTNMNRLAGRPHVKTIETVPQPLMASHGQGTCRMGRNPADSVVDLNLVVHGFDNLMVVDGSVMPVQVQSPHYPISALAHKIADTFIRRDLWNIP